MGFSRQEYQSGLPCTTLGDLPDQGIEPASPALQKDSLTSEPSGGAQAKHYRVLKKKKKKKKDEPILFKKITPLTSREEGWDLNASWNRKEKILRESILKGPLG